LLRENVSHFRDAAVDVGHHAPDLVAVAPEAGSCNVVDLRVAKRFDELLGERSLIESVDGLAGLGLHDADEDKHYRDDERQYQQELAEHTPH